MSDNVQARLMSRPVGVEWAGWRTDTYTLQQNGWEIAAEYDMMHQAYRLLFRHRMMRLYAVTSSHEVDNIMEITSPTYDQSRLPLFRVQHVAPTIETVRIPSIDFSNFQQIDAQPSITYDRVERIEDMNIFHVPLTRAEEIVVERADMSVIEHLEAIKELQSEEQQRIRDRIIREGASPPGSAMGTGPQMEVIANVVSFRSKAA